jgi:hypothetical protein
VYRRPWVVGVGRTSPPKTGLGIHSRDESEYESDPLPSKHANDRRRQRDARMYILPAVPCRRSIESVAMVALCHFVRMRSRATTSFSVCLCTNGPPNIRPTRCRLFEHVPKSILYVRGEPECISLSHSSQTTAIEGCCIECPR